MVSKLLKIITCLIFLYYFYFPVDATTKTIQNNLPATPLEKANFTKLTSQDELMSYLDEIGKLSKKVSVTIIGKSVAGREIPVVKITEDKTFGSKRSSKPVVLIFEQQHGNEPSGKEAALMLSRELALGSLQKLLHSMDILIVPQVNPDGAEQNKRLNDNDIDLNRNHVILSEPESYALHHLILEWLPEVSVDIHETDASSKDWFRNGYMKDADIFFDCVTNLNIASKIRDFSTNVFIPQVGELIQDDGFRFSRYIVGGPPDKRRIRHSTTHINDGRQNMGIYNTFSFIFEGKRFADVLSNIKRRAAAQLSGMTAFLKIIAQHKMNILTIVGSARQQLIDDSPPGDNLIHIRMDYYPDSTRKTLTLPIFDLYSWQHTQKELDNYEPLVKIKLSVAKPIAYIFPKIQPRLIELLIKHQIKMFQLKKATKIEAEIYTIMDIQPAQEEDKPAEDISETIQSEVINFKRGDMVVFLQQKAASLIPLLLEPQSSWGIVTEGSGHNYRFAEYLKNGVDYPIYRMIKKVQFDRELVED